VWSLKDHESSGALVGPPLKPGNVCASPLAAQNKMPVKIVARDKKLLGVVFIFRFPSYFSFQILAPVLKDNALLWRVPVLAKKFCFGIDLLQSSNCCIRIAIIFLLKLHDRHSTFFGFGRLNYDLSKCCSHGQRNAL